MPPDHAGLIEGRSSYARLRLVVRCYGDFIKPGLEGHMPPELVNLGRSPIRLVFFLPICQLKIMYPYKPTDPHLRRL